MTIHAHTHTQQLNTLDHIPCPTDSSKVCVPQTEVSLGQAQHERRLCLDSASSVFSGFSGCVSVDSITNRHKTTFHAFLAGSDVCKMSGRECLPGKDWAHCGAQS